MYAGDITFDQTFHRKVTDLLRKATTSTSTLFRLNCQSQR